ncbi:alpha/beta hydrolase domain-containing protein [Gordonia sp. CPCC 205515]|uniref:alpha/beta hydrolase domain-containing protein n=1 Tax=Gordonia sp. CPCC 205515 TaxID=3140791 RepID=UPI003AF3EED3
MISGITFRELTGGNGCSILSASPGPELDTHGYRENEYAATGLATRSEMTENATIAPAGEDSFTTRVLVRRPERDVDFNGTLVVEWLNVSSGTDAAPDYTYLAEELVRSGYAWAGVSAQYIGIEGGHGSVSGIDAPAPQSLAEKDPDRYAGLHHPGDAYCFDIFGVVGDALRSPDDNHPMSELTVRQTLAVGESQSAMALTTYANSFAAYHKVFDGILIHSRAAGDMPLGDVGSGIAVDTVFSREPTTIRDDLDIPVFIVQTETDVLTNFQFHRSRQPDTDRVRIWEIAGTAHADLHQIGPYEEMLGCPTPVNRGQQRFPLRAALHHLNAWAAGASTPPIAAPLEVTTANGTTGFVLDDVGNVLSGVRTPCVDAPTQVLSGVVTGDLPRICILFGSTTDAPVDALRRRYDDARDYLEKYHAATDLMIADGFALPADRDEIVADARPDILEGIASTAP